MRSTSFTGANSPACPATPPIAKAFSSSTSPVRSRLRSGHTEVGANISGTGSRRRVRTSEISMKSVERHAALLLDCLAQYDEVQVRVDGAGAGRRLGPFAMNLLVDVFLGAAARHEVDFSALLDLGDLLVERTPSGKARAMGEKMAEGDVPLAVHAKVVEEARDAVVEAHLGVPRQHHHGDRGGERFG